MLFLNSFEIFQFEKTTMMCESTSDAESTFRWFKVGSGEVSEVEVTNVVGGGIVVAGGELSVGVESLNNGDVFRCKLDDEVSRKLKCF